MAVKKTIAIVDATGKAGSALAKKLATEPFQILLISEDKEKLSNLEEEIKTTSPEAEIEKIDCIKEACWEADIIVLAVDYISEREVAQKIKEVATQKIVVHLINPQINSDSTVASIEELKNILPYSQIFTVLEDSVTQPTAEIALDDKVAVQKILDAALVPV